MTPFEALYGRKCRTPLYWDQTRGSKFFGPKLIQEAEEQVRIIRENLKVAQTRQKSYVDNRRRPLEFEEGDCMYLKVSPLHGMRRFKVKDKLSPRFIGPFRVLGELERWPINSSYLIIYQMYIMYSMCLNLRSVSLSLRNSNQWKSPVFRENLTYTEYPIKILDTMTRVTRNKVIKMCKVQWSHHGEDKATWKREEELRIDFPHLFPSPS
jgi:hypothetical protein